MPLTLMYITNNEKIAAIAENSGVDWIVIDLEIIGKVERQGHLNTVISHHSIDDVRKIRNVLLSAALVVRVNPIFEGSKSEIDTVIADGADIVMLPYFKTCEEVRKFVTYVNDRAKTCLLLETPEAVENIDLILETDGIDYVHIGLNDLHLGYNMNFMFELVANGTVEAIIRKIKQKRIPYGFGGIAQLGKGALPAEYIIAEHYRLDSSMAILSRSFCDSNNTAELETLSTIFQSGIQQIRDYERKLAPKTADFYTHNQLLVRQKVAEIVENFG